MAIGLGWFGWVWPHGAHVGSVGMSSVELGWLRLISAPLRWTGVGEGDMRDGEAEGDVSVFFPVKLFGLPVTFFEKVPVNLKKCP